jgi:hypothetical protein
MTKLTGPVREYANVPKIGSYDNTVWGCGVGPNGPLYGPVVDLVKRVRTFGSHGGREHLVSLKDCQFVTEYFNSWEYLGC